MHRSPRSTAKKSSGTTVTLGMSQPASEEERCNCSPSQTHQRRALHSPATLCPVLPISRLSLSCCQPCGPSGHSLHACPLPASSMASTTTGLDQALQLPWYHGPPGWARTWAW